MKTSHKKKMDISLEDWQKINESMRELDCFRGNVQKEILSILSNYENDSAELLLELYKKLDFDIPVYFTTVQPEWTGGDSDNPDNYVYNEPHIVEQWLKYKKV